MHTKSKEEKGIAEFLAEMIANIVGGAVALVIIYYVIFPFVYLLYLCFQ